MQFGRVQAKKFGTLSGSYSTVTNREEYDSQITLTDHEADLLISHFGRENIHIGNVQSNPVLAKKSFRLFPTGKRISLNVVFPKSKKTELRLYISSRAGFKPVGGQVWFMFIRDGELWLGAMSEKVWRFETAENREDEYEEFYQEAVNESDQIRIARLRERDAFARDRKIAVKRMELAGYKCEYDSTHNLFVSRFSRKPYLEAHHLVPMGMQNEFKISLDTIHNVFCLCPNCHRAIHHAEEAFARKILDILAQRRPVLKAYSLNPIDLFSLYAVEVIK